MYEFTPFKKTDKLSYESFIQFPRELLNREEYKVLSPNAMLLYSILTDRLELSFKQITGQYLQSQHHSSKQQNLIP